MKWTQVEKHWQELASKANSERRKATPQAQPGVELGTRDPEPTVDADPQAPLVDEQATDDSAADTTNPRTAAEAPTPGRLPK